MNEAPDLAVAVAEYDAAPQGDQLLGRLAPLLLLSDRGNWIAEDGVDIDLKFLTKQNL